MKCFRWFFICIALLVPEAVLADGSTGNVHVKAIVVEPSESWFEVTNAPNPDGCGSSQRLKLVEAASVTGRIYAAALASKSAHTSVSLGSADARLRLGDTLRRLSTQSRSLIDWARFEALNRAVSYTVRIFLSQLLHSSRRSDSIPAINASGI